MDDSWATPPFGSWGKVLAAWRALQTLRTRSAASSTEARVLFWLSLEEWLVGDFSKWVTVVLLGATVIAGCLALAKQAAG
jgi:hypothetical protein